jgi:phospholipase/lecithinase/hemolysin
MKFASKMVGATALACACMGASALPYTSLVVFGDSLLDPGNAAALTRQADGSAFFPPPITYADGVLNRPVTAAERLADRLGAPTVLGWPNAQGANNFAVRGALTGNGNFNALVNSPAGLSALYPALAETGIAQQIARYQPSATQGAHPLYLLWGGANDLFLGFAQAQAGVDVDFTGLLTQAVTNMSANIGQLVARGARDILVPSLPDLGLTPLALSNGPSFAANASALSLAYNHGLSALISGTDSALEPMGVNVVGFDTAAYLRQTVAQPDGLFTNVTQSCLSGGPSALASQCAGYLFFDDVHPTDLAQALLAERFAGVASSVSPVPEPQTWALMLAALGMLVAWTRRRGASGGAPPRASATA